MIPSETEAAIAQAITAGRLVEAIKLVRAATGVSLADARLYVMALAGSLPNDRKMGAGMQAAFAFEERRPGESPMIRFIAIGTLALAAGLIAAIVALVAHAHVVPAN